LDDSDKDKDYIPPGENKRHLGEFDDDLEVEVINNDSTVVDMHYSDNEQNILSLMNYLCENVCQEPLPPIIVSSETEYSVELYTKSGKQRKRKKFKTSVQKRKDIKKKKLH